MTFRGKEWKRFGNHYRLLDTHVKVYFWNSGKNQWYMVACREFDKFGAIYKSFSKGPEARDEAIAYALELGKSNPAPGAGRANFDF